MHFSYVTPGVGLSDFCETFLKQTQYFKIANKQSEYAADQNYPERGVCISY